MTSQFLDQVILITGAGSGIGRAVAIKLSQLGALLALSDISSTSLAETLTQCAPGNHLTSTFDVGSSQACNDFVALIMKTYSRLNHVFNCAGINPTAMPTTEVTDEYWNKILTTNLTGTFNISRASIPHLSSSSSHPSTIHPSILNTSSIAGLAPTAGFTPYCSSKFAIIGLSKCLALELGPRGIRVNALAPGYIDTPTNACVVRGEEGVREAEGRVALGRMGSVVEVVDVVLFLLGEGGRYVNGSVVEVSGGIF